MIKQTKLWQNQTSLIVHCELYTSIIEPSCHYSRTPALILHDERRPQRHQLTSRRDLLRRLNPSQTAQNVHAITTLVPDLTEDLLSSVDQPLEIRRCKRTNRDYLLCDYNRDGDSWRSPWSNEFEPAIEGGIAPTGKVRAMEVKAGEAFDVYREL